MFTAWLFIYKEIRSVKIPLVIVNIEMNIWEYEEQENFNNQEKQEDY